MVVGWVSQEIKVLFQMWYLILKLRSLQIPKLQATYL